MLELDKLLEKLVTDGGSDLHIVSGDPVRMRIHGDLMSITDQPVSAKDVYEAFKEIMTIYIRDNGS